MKRTDVRDAEDRITRRNLIMFPLGTVGRDMIYSLVTSYLLTFVLYAHILTAPQVTAIMIIMIAARVFDALNDPLMGCISERTRTRFGKFKPWLSAGILSTAGVVYLAFNITLEGWSFVIFFGIIYLLYSITYTMHDIAYWSMIPSLSSDSNLRNQYTSRAVLFAGIGGVLASSLIPVLTAGDHAIGGNALTAYGRVALIIAVLSLLFMAFTVFGVREKQTAEEERTKAASYREIISTITRNHQLLWIALIFLLQQISNGMVSSGLGQTYIYLKFGYNGTYYAICQTLGVSVTARRSFPDDLLPGHFPQDAPQDTDAAADRPRGGRLWYHAGFRLPALVRLFFYPDVRLYADQFRAIRTVPDHDDIHHEYD